MDDKLITELRKAASAYVMPPIAKQVVANSHLLVLCGVTAAGKNTVSGYLVSHGNFDYVVTHTTRKPRENHGVLEQNGKDYWFVSYADMLNLINNSAFVEIKNIHNENFSGTSIASIENILKEGKRPVSVIDVQGALELTKAVPNLRPVFILPPSYDIWMERLGTRGFMSFGEKERRLHSAKMELETAINNTEFLFVINNEMEQTVDEIKMGVDSGEIVQSERRKLAEELLEYVNQT